MELKRLKSMNWNTTENLLIVPYGIETLYRPQTALKTCLLIVPYGIETLKLHYQNKFDCLLIVPYGIETQSRPRRWTEKAGF